MSQEATRSDQGSRNTCDCDAGELGRLRAALEAAERRYQALTGFLLEAVFESDIVHNPDGAYTYWSERVTDVLGYPPEAFFADHLLWSKHLHPDDRDWVLRDSRELFESGHTVDMEYRWIKPSGEVVWIEDRGQVERGPNGEPLRLHGTKADVTARKRLEEQLQRSEREARLLYQAALAISGELELEAQMQRVLEATMQLTAADEAHVALVDAAERSIETVAASGEGGVMVGLRQPVGTGLLGQVIATNRCLRSDDLLDDPRTFLPPEMREVGARSWLCAPLADHARAFGALIALRKEVRPFTDEDEARLQALAALTAAVVRQGRLREEIGRLAVVEERTRLARDLHDSVTQSLFSASMLAQTAQRLWKPDPDRAKERLDRASELCSGALAEMRALIFELRPDALAVEGLVSALRKHAAVRQARDGIAVDVLPRDERRLPSEVEEAAYRIAREALHNVVKHARATRALVRLDFEPARLLLEVQDDGRGFDPAARVGRGLGLTSMRERAEALGGTLTLESAPGAGSTIRAEIPVPADD
jgi:PAS domain S-box-containing protein